MNINPDVKNILYGVIGAAVSLIPMGPLYLLDVQGKNIFTILIKSLLKLVV